MSRIPRPHLGIMAVIVPLVILLLVLIALEPARATEVTVGTDPDGHRLLTLANPQIACAVTIGPDGQLWRETIRAQRPWLANHGATVAGVELDGGFAWELVWNSWRSPGKVHNSDNPVVIDQRGFRYLDHAAIGDTLTIRLRDPDLDLEADVVWTLAEDDFWVRRRVVLRDPRARGHRLRKVWQRRGAIHDTARLVKTGDYGQPVAFTVQDGGAFLGLEWPAGTTTIEPAGCGAVKLECWEDLERPVDAAGAAGAWSVAAVTPEPYVRLWFDRYLDAIRVAPLAPYLLYNSWYDVRSRTYVMEHLTGDERDVMTADTVLRIARDFRTRFVEPYGLALDAFVLDDGWDVYDSDWQLDAEAFPDGLAPVVRELGAMGTRLGIWFGPTGGYSYRQRRLDWMGAHGYEVTANGMLCLGGPRYHDLLKRRNLAFIQEHGVGYFKWDGIQFACSDPAHGHPIGLAARRAILEHVIDLSRTMRAADPDVYLNITSGTWLSPWWVAIANMIWMQGDDYGYADVPSLSPRDAAMTYRDLVLYDDFRQQDCWFPLANLMTHGIIKGHLQQLGGEAEPLDRFTDNAVLYFARGVAMWELYVSPNLLTDDEFAAIARAALWARDRFPILRHTVMIGGAPARDEAYGYAHFAGERGILALRNPGPDRQVLPVVLDPAHGLARDATGLAATRTYPWRGGLGALYAAGDTLHIPLEGYQAAVWEILPADEATEPLLGGEGLAYDATVTDSRTVRIAAWLHLAAGQPAEVTLLNPQRVARVDGVAIDPGGAVDLPVAAIRRRPAGGEPAVASRVDPDGHRRARFAAVGPTAASADRVQHAILCEAAAGDTLPGERLRLSAGPGQAAPRPAQTGENRWAWYLLADGEWSLDLAPDPAGDPWRGRLAHYLVHDVAPATHEFTLVMFDPVAPAPLPPRPLATGRYRFLSLGGER